MSEDHRGDGWWMANDGNWYPPELHPSTKGDSDALATSQLTAESPGDGAVVGPQFPDLFQAALQGNHLADNVSVKYDGDDERNVPVSVAASTSRFGATSPRAAGDSVASGSVGEFTGATPAKRRWRRH